MQLIKHRGIFLAASVFFLTFVLFSKPSFAQIKILAVVNNDIITEKDLRDFMNFIHIQLSGQYQGEELKNKVDSMRADLLDKLLRLRYHLK